MSKASPPEVPDLQSLFEALIAEGAASAGKIFHSQGLKVGAHFVAFVHREGLGIKLPPDRVRGLVGCGQALPFVGSRQRVMKGWAIVPSGTGPDLRCLLREAIAAEQAQTPIHGGA